MTYRTARRIAVTVIGGSLALLGALLLVLPGPGLLLIAVALFVLAAEFGWARRWLRRLRERSDAPGRLPDPGESDREPRRS